MSDIEVRISGGMFDRLLTAWAGLSPDRRGMLIMLAVLCLAALCVGTWALFFRKPRRRRHRHGQGHHASAAADRSEAVDEDDADSSGHRHRRKRRRSRGDHLPRNPTLAETGGLPPVRQGDPPEILP
jgi:type VI protein secretion system component VasK